MIRLTGMRTVQCHVMSLLGHAHLVSLTNAGCPAGFAWSAVASSELAASAAAFAMVIDFVL